jgi:hypothetical protein
MLYIFEHNDQAYEGVNQKSTRNMFTITFDANYFDNFDYQFLDSMPISPGGPYPYDSFYEFFYWILKDVVALDVFVYARTDAIDISISSKYGTPMEVYQRYLKLVIGKTLSIIRSGEYELS